MSASELLGGCAAGLTQDALLHPVDTIRARLNAGGAADAGGTASALLSEARAVVRADGVAGLYRGYGFCLAVSPLCNAIYFGSYRASRRYFDGSGPLHDGAAGFTAECLASTFWTPADIVKQRMQVAPSTGLGVADAARASIAAAGGVHGLWRGYLASLAVWGPFSCSYFALYEATKAWLSGGDGAAATASVNMAAGLSAGSVAAVLTQPLDCVRTRMQVGAVEASAGIVDTLRLVLAEGGQAALWRGALARALWLAPGCGITITVFEAVDRFVGGGK